MYFIQLWFTRSKHRPKDHSTQHSWIKSNQAPKTIMFSKSNNYTRTLWKLFWIRKKSQGDVSPWRSYMYAVVTLTYTLHQSQTDANENAM